MNTEMADGAAQRCVAQIGEALFGQPGMTLVEIANRRAEMEALRADASRLDWLEATASHYGDGYTEPREVAVGFCWHQSKDCQDYPGIRPAIDATMKEQAE